MLGSRPDNFHLYPAASVGRKQGMGPPQLATHAASQWDYLEERADWLMPKQRRGPY